MEGVHERRGRFVAFGGAVTRWTYPDPHDYIRYFPEIIRVFGGNAFQHGTAYYIEGFLGAALWLPPDVQPREEEMEKLLQRTISEKCQEEVFSVLEQMGNYHPTDPHWYLLLIGVDPIQHGNGYGSELMKHALLPSIKIISLLIWNPQTQKIFRCMNDTDLRYLVQFKSALLLLFFPCCEDHNHNRKPSSKKKSLKIK